MCSFFSDSYIYISESVEIWKEKKKKPTRGGKTLIVIRMLGTSAPSCMHFSIVIRDETRGRVGAIALGPRRLDRRFRGGFRGIVALADARRA
jgi:hypothetical protein